MLKVFLAAYVFLALLKLWLFMWQRTALNVCRAGDLPVNMKGVLVPYWQIIAFWPIWILKGLMLILIGVFSKWYWPIIIFLSDFIFISALIPIPHSFFLNKMEKRLENPRVRLTNKDFIKQNEEIKIQLLDAVKLVHNKYNI